MQRRNGMARKLCAAVLGLGLVAVMSGCVQEGLSAHEATVNGHSNQPAFSSYVYSLYNETDPAPAARPSLHLPLRIGVVQLGEVAPPQSLLDELRNNSGLIAAAQPMPGVFESDSSSNPNLPGGDLESRARRHINQMRGYAHDLGLNYVLLIGGTVDYGTSSNGLSVLDLTVVGAFIMPSKELGATGRATGSLIDVATGRSVLAVTAEANSKRLASSFGEEGDQKKMLFALRNELLTKLGKEFVIRVSNP